MSSGHLLCVEGVYVVCFCLAGEVGKWRASSCTLLPHTNKVERHMSDSPI